MSPITSRRSFLKGGLVTSSILIAGCSTLTNDSESDPDWASSSDLGIYNETASEQKLEVALFETEGEPDSDIIPYTVTAEATQPAGELVYEREFRVESNDEIRDHKVLTKSEEEREYRLSVHLNGGKKATYVFPVQYGSGLTLLKIEILSPSKVRFSGMVV